METRRKGRRVILLMTCIASCVMLVFSGLNFTIAIGTESIYEHVEENEFEGVDESELILHEGPYRRFDERYGLMDAHFGRWDETVSSEEPYRHFDERHVLTEDRFGTWGGRGPSEYAVRENDEIMPLFDIPRPSGDYQVREPIRINGNSDFASQATDEGWPGDGTEGDPYIIEGYEIDGTGHGYCVYVGNTTVYFVLKSNYVHSASGKPVDYYWDAGVYLHKVRNALIDGNTALNNGRKGIYISSSSSSNTVINNTASGSSFGIEIRSSGNKIINNTVYGNTKGIAIGSSNNVLSDNTAYSNRRGIAIGGSGHTITNNTILNNGKGIWLWFSNNNIISNNTVSNNYEEGIRLFVSHGNIVKDNIISNSRMALFLWGSNNNELSNNTVSGCGLAVLLRDTDNNYLSKNTLSNNNNGIVLFYSTNQTLTGNTMENNGLFIEGNTLQRWNTHEIDTSNTVNGKPVYYWKDRTGDTVPADAGQVILVNCNHITVSDFNINNAGAGVQLGYSDNNYITNNTLTHHGYDAVYLYRSHNNYIADNTLSNNGWMGLFLWRSNGNTVLRNTVSNNGDHGILLWGWSNDNTFTDNTVSNSRRMGFAMWLSGGNIITNNHIFSNNGIGIILDTSVTGNTLIGNVMENDGLAIAGGFLVNWNTHTIDTSNTVNGKPIYYLKNRISGTIPIDGAASVGQIILANCTGVTVEKLNIGDIYVAISLGFSDDNIITGNTLTNNRFGVYIIGSENNHIYRNIFIENMFQGYEDSYHNQFNNWDNGDPAASGKGGNYWSDYSEIRPPPKDRGDGIGDVPYTISARGRDNYPWLDIEMIEVAHIEITPVVANITAGETFLFDAVAFDADHNRMGEVGNLEGFTWSIDADAGGRWLRGLYISEYAGTWNVTGAYGDITATAVLTVDPGDAEYISISPGDTTILAGDTQTFTATAYDGIGNPFDVTGETDWSAYGSAVGVWEDNVYHPQYTGEWVVTGDYKGLTDTTGLTVVYGEPVYISISPENTTVAVGGTQTYTAVAYNELGTEIRDVTEETDFWVQAGAGGIWTDNVYTSGSVGTWTVRGDYNGLTDTVYLTVEYGDPEYIVVSPEVSVITAGDTQTFTAVAYNEFGTEIGDITEETDWSVDISAGGLWTDNTFTSEFAGAWTVSAVYNGLRCEARLTVEPGNITHIVIHPPDQTITAGYQCNYKAETYDQFGNLVGDVTNETHWDINSEAGGIWSDNEYTSEFSGTWTVSGVYDEHTDTVQLTVLPDRVHSVIISPSQERIVKEGESLQFTAAAYDKYGNLITDEAAEFIWSNTDEGGMFYREREGVYIITATYEGETSEPVKVTVETTPSGNWWFLMPIAVTVIVALALFIKRPWHGRKERAREVS